jgi:hypothetical protein
MGRQFRFSGFFIAAAVTTLGCSDDGDGSASDGQVTAAWTEYCVATFSSDHVAVDGFGDTQFTARAMERYLMSSYAVFLGTGRAELFYLTADGPAVFEVEGEPDGSGFPFTSNCEFNTGAAYIGVFTDVSVYDGEDLSTKLCDLSAGDAAVDNGTGSGYSASSLNFSGPATYQVQLNAFADRCGGASEGFISVPETQDFGSTTWLVPHARVFAPE